MITHKFRLEVTDPTGQYPPSLQEIESKLSEILSEYFVSVYEGWE